MESNDEKTELYLLLGQLESNLEAVKTRLKNLERSPVPSNDTEKGEPRPISNLAMGGERDQQYFVVQFGEKKGIYSSFSQLPKDCGPDGYIPVIGIKAAREILKEAEISGVDSSYHSRAIRTREALANSYESLKAKGWRGWEIPSLRPNYQRIGKMVQLPEIPARGSIRGKGKRALFHQTDPKEYLTSSVLARGSDTVARDEFEHFYNKARTNDGPFVSVNRRGKSKILASHDMEPELLYKFFICGLIDTVYFAGDLTTLAAFPVGLQQAIHNYISRVKAHGKTIYIKDCSSYPDWEEEKFYPAYHYMRVGVAGKYINPGKELQEAEPIEDDKLAQARAELLEGIILAMQQIHKESQIKVNYASDNVLLTSAYGKILTKEDADKIAGFEEKFHKGDLKISALTKDKMVPILEKYEGNFFVIEGDVTDVSG